MNCDPSATTIPLLVLDHDEVLFHPAVDDWHAITLIACLSDDPVDWSEVALVWPRYQNDGTPEFVDALSFQTLDLHDALAQVNAQTPWVAIDLAQKRIFAGGGYEKIPRDVCFGLGDEEAPRNPPVRVSIHLPPWWEVSNDANLETIRRPRSSPIRIPDPCRDVLWGKPLVERLAKLLCERARSPQWQADNDASDVRKLYTHSVAVHRDWLMTPRDDLDGRMPRECLHGGLDWLDRVIQAQQSGITRGREALPIAAEMLTYQFGPMGREEVCMYFDCCRELIGFGWKWIVEHQHDVEAGIAEQPLAEALADRQDAWMDTPDEDDSPPAVILATERCRVPRVVGQDGAHHVVDCDCPICQMMADDVFGPTFVHIDGHHLELDDEFAFSLCETREEWEATQGSYAAFDASLDAEQADAFTDGGLAAKRPLDDELDSPWQNAHVNWEMTQLGPMANMAIGFLLADMVAALQENEGPQSDIDALNDAFRAYRQATSDQQPAAAEAFKSTLESVASRNVFLIARSADLQSKLDELLRVATTTPDDGPF